MRNFVIDMSVGQDETRRRRTVVNSVVWKGETEDIIYGVYVPGTLVQTAVDRISPPLLAGARVVVDQLLHPEIVDEFVGVTVGGLAGIYYFKPEDLLTEGLSGPQTLREKACVASAALSHITGIDSGGFLFRPAPRNRPLL
jgi:hypothetical protein